MKVIDLLNKIANKEEVPKKIKYDYKNFEFIGGAYEDEKGKDLCYYYDSCMVFLTDEVEIIEEEKKIPEKLSTWFSLETSHSKELNREYANTNFENMYEKINEIIDCLDYLKNKGE